MVTIAIPRRRLESFKSTFSRTTAFSSLALASGLCLALFLVYLIAYQTSAFDSWTTATKAFWSGVFAVICPALALVFSTMSLRRYVKMHQQVRGMVLAYISFSISSLYFVTALAMPFVLLGLYLVYVYIW
jgi:hypothetical protein